MKNLAMKCRTILANIYYYFNSFCRKKWWKFRQLLYLQDGLELMLLYLMLTQRHFNVFSVAETISFLFELWLFCSNQFCLNILLLKIQFPIVFNVIWVLIYMLPASKTTSIMCLLFRTNVPILSILRNMRNLALYGLKLWII